MAPPSAAERRTSTRQTGRNVNRPDNYYASNREAPPTRTAKPSGPQFFPALTHFSDSAAAVPKELIKHFSMLREVEAKACDPEKEIQELFKQVDALPVPSRADNYVETMSRTGNTSTAGSVAGSVHQEWAEIFPPNLDSMPQDEQAMVKRRQLLLKLRLFLHQMIPTLDEKIVVLSSANQTLSRCMARMNSSYKHLPEEISEEARLGSANHWAYLDIREEKKKAATASERVRRDVQSANNLAAAAAQLEGEAAERSALRREAMRAKRGQQQTDSDFDDRPAAKKHKHAAREPARKAPPVQRRTDPEKAQGLGITNATQGGGKRRKAEKDNGAQPMERSLSAALHQAKKGGNGNSPRQTPSAEPGQRKQRAAPAAAPPKKRNQAAGVPSPQVASSPLVGSLASKDVATPAQRPQSTRARQNSNANSTASAIQDVQQHSRPASAIPNRTLNGEASSNLVQELEQAAAQTSTVYNANAQKEGGEGPANSNLKREAEAEPDTKEQVVDAPTPVVTRAGRVSKNSTPIQSTFPESAPMGRTRSNRNNKDNSKDNSGHNSHASSESNHPISGPSAQKRSHKKGPATPGGSGNIQAAAAAVMAGVPSLAAHSTAASPFQHHNNSHPSRPYSSTSNPYPHASHASQSHNTHSPRPDSRNQQHQRGTPDVKEQSHHHHQSHSKSDKKSQQPPSSSSAGAARSHHPPPPPTPSAPAPASRNNSNRGGGGSTGPPPAAPTTTTTGPEDEEIDNDDDGDEELFCFCMKPSYGEMVGCDNENCERKWFHYGCVGLRKAPSEKKKWYCSEGCKQDAARNSRPGSSRQ